MTNKSSSSSINKPSITRVFSKDVMTNKSSSSSINKVKLGPDPILLSRKEVDALYETLQAVKSALDELHVDYIVTGGSLLGAIRQHSILFCDDDIDLAIIDYDGTIYKSLVVPHLQERLGTDFVYQIKPWEGGDRIRPKRMSNIFLDLFVLRQYESDNDLIQVIGKKKNGQLQSETYVQQILQKITSSAHSQGETSPIYPCWHFSTRKSIELWSKEIYRQNELFPINKNLKMGPIIDVNGPNKPVRLLKRAFGKDCFEVYYQSASHKTHKKSNKATNNNNNHHHHKDTTKTNDTTTDLPPLVSSGGLWEDSQKTELKKEHYLPMQPISRAARRPTLHGREQLMKYLQEQTQIEEEEDDDDDNDNVTTNNTGKILSSKRPNRTVYMDGVFDLFHIGHLEAINKCAQLGNKVIIGVTGDEDATGYKRCPIVPEKERVAIVQALDLVDQVICPCPLVVTEDFMKQLSIDLVVHGFANDADAERQREFFAVPMDLGKFQRISYYNGLSTTDRIKSIQNLLQEEKETFKSEKPQWFGFTLAAATDNSQSIPIDPFPFFLRQVIEPHIEKARTARKQALAAIRQATGTPQYDSTMETFKQRLATEGSLTSERVVELRSALLTCCDLPDTYDLSQIHCFQGSKINLLQNLTKNYASFQVAYDEFVRSICAPIMAKLYPCKTIYYQAFPCLRIIQPTDFSIGPHSDVAYGHHPCSVNFYVPMTKIGGTSALFLESRLGSEDWHPIEGDIGLIKHFSGGTCLHWTTENKTNYTRVSIDFRLIPGPLFHSLKCGGSYPGGKIDVYRNKLGYYSQCTLDDDSVHWTRKGPMLSPDARNGFPWTVKDWDQFLKKNKNQSS